MGAAQRAEVLQRLGLLDSPREEAFDRITRLATALLQVPVSLFTVVGPERQFFKSAAGLSEPWHSLRESPIVLSFCQYVVESEAEVVVQEARTDPRYLRHEGIAALGVEAYAGTPIRAEGEVVGALCVIDHQARTFPPAQLALLRDLGELVGTELELRRARAGAGTLHVEARGAPGRPETRQLEDALNRDSAAAWLRLADLLENISDGFVFLGRDWRYRYVNKRGGEFLGRDAAALRGKHIWEEFPEGRGQRFHLAYERAFRETTNTVFEEFYPPLGKWFENRIHPTAEGLAIFFNDVTERHRQREELVRRERHFRALLEHGTDAVLLVDPQGRVSWSIVPPGAPALAAAPATDLFSFPIKDDLDAVRGAFQRAAARPGSPVRFRARLRPAGGEPRLFEGVFNHLVHDEDVGAVVVNLRDVSETEELRSRFEHAGRLEALGRLAASVAHDFNNLLTVILSSSELLEDPQSLEAIEIRDAALKSASLTRQLLAFGRRSPLELQNVSLDELVSGHRALLSRLLPEDIKLSIEPGGVKGRVQADPGQLSQVLVNLVANARDAIPGRGTIRITTGERTMALQETALPVRVAILSVHDDGVGMDEDTRARIFEPFFTTKNPGQGTGLGLSTVYGVVRQCGGAIEVDSAPGRGTRFDILLPQEGPAQPAGRAPPEIPRGNGETVLLIEDDEHIRSFTSRLLVGLGYHAVASVSPEEALRAVAKLALPPRVLIAERALVRGRGGVELPAELAGLRRVVLSESGEPAGADVALRKPFDLGELARAVREALGG